MYHESRLVSRMNWQNQNKSKIKDEIMFESFLKSYNQIKFIWIIIFIWVKKKFVIFLIINKNHNID